jgi:enoyl-CoA hydratase/carnithine racemase
VGWVTLNRPSAINAINDAIAAGVPATLRAFDEDPQVRVIVIRGAGPRGFCAGADLKESRPPTTPFATRSLQSSSNWIRAFDHVSKPVIASVHGFCLGGGLEIALACDLRVASTDAVFALPDTGLGLIPGGGAPAPATRVGLGRSTLADRRAHRRDDLRIGLVNRSPPTRTVAVT